MISISRRLLFDLCALNRLGPGIEDTWQRPDTAQHTVLPCLLYTSDAADEEDSVDLGGRRILN